MFLIGSTYAAEVTLLVVRTSCGGRTLNLNCLDRRKGPWTPLDVSCTYKKWKNQNLSKYLNCKCDHSSAPLVRMFNSHRIPLWQTAKLTILIKSESNGRISDCSFTIYRRNKSKRIGGCSTGDHKSLPMWVILYDQVFTTGIASATPTWRAKTN